MLPLDSAFRDLPLTGFIRSNFGVLMAVLFHTLLFWLIHSSVLFPKSSSMDIPRKRIRDILPLIFPGLVILLWITLHIGIVVSGFASKYGDTGYIIALLLGAISVLTWSWGAFGRNWLLSGGLSSHGDLWRWNLFLHTSAISVLFPLGGEQ